MFASNSLFSFAITSLASNFSFFVVYFLIIVAINSYLGFILIKTLIHCALTW
ncbi:hypothetical protein Scep_009325 [Stephania cephalantha]|uniref:Uncharacterized protein n=1 Tax=Stephania cephalantha TaxID=152367 RepID=A0AAP0PE76_9MAGN